jgi:hypothetical protein
MCTVTWKLNIYAFYVIENTVSIFMYMSNMRN